MYKNLRKTWKIHSIVGGECDTLVVMQKYPSKMTVGNYVKC